MKITRNNLVYELTKEELFEAWQEAQTKIIQEEIKNYLKKDSTKQEYYLLSNNKDFLTSVVHKTNNFQQKIGWSLEKIIIKNVRALKNEAIANLFSETEKKLLIGLFCIGVYSSEEIGLGFISLESSAPSSPKSLEDIFKLFGMSASVYEFCDELSFSAKELLYTKIIPMLEDIRKDRLPDLKVENFYQFLGISEETSQNHHVTL